MKNVLNGFVIFSILALCRIAQAQAPSKPGDPVAVINGQPIHEQDLATELGSKLLQLRNQEYQMESKVLDDLISHRILETEAKQRGVSADKLLQDDVDSKIPEPAEEEVEGYYLAVQKQIDKPFEEIKPQLLKTVKLLKITEARQRYVDSLRTKHNVLVLLSPPKVEVGYDASRVRGNTNAPVTIVEFSDFLCPYCKRAHATMTDLLKRYNGQVKLAYRDFPMRTLHPQAQAAAEASRCAGDQGKFWEYSDALLDDQAKLDEAELEAITQRTGLNEKTFHSCLSSGKFKAAIDQDVQDGTKAGVAGTPAFFINGEFLSGAQPEAAFVKIIDRELAAAGDRSVARASR